MITQPRHSGQRGGSQSGARARPPHDMSLRNHSTHSSHLSTLITRIDLTGRGRFQAERVQQTGNSRRRRRRASRSVQAETDKQTEKSIRLQLLWMRSVFNSRVGSLLSAENYHLLPCHCSLIRAENQSSVRRSLKKNVQHVCDKTQNMAENKRRSSLMDSNHKNRTGAEEGSDLVSDW